MDIDLRKTATDAAYIAVGAGVLGFQQAQVRRREARARLEERAHDVKVAAESLQAKVSAFRHELADRAVDLRDKARETAASARTVDPRQLVEPVVDEVKGRVEPILEQLKAIHLPEPVQALPDQLAKAAATGRERVRDLRGGAPARPAAGGGPVTG